MASDTTDGSSTVKISGQEVMLKNKSYFKRSTGDEAGCAAKKGVITSSNMGKVYFTTWSMDVKVEGENVVRHLDMTTHNHACPTANEAIPWAHLDSMSKSVQKACATQIDNLKEACEGQKTDNCTPECRAKQKCILVPKGKAKEYCCEPDTTGDHVFEDHWIWEDEDTLMPDFEHLGEKNKSGRYVKPGGPYDGAPTLCANKSRYAKIHGAGHGARGVREDELIGKKMKYAKARQISLDGLKAQCAYAKKDTGADPECDEECFKKQIDAFYGAGGEKECHPPDRKQALKEEQRQKALDDLKPKRKGRGGQ
jgi:hypothetical protein